MIDTYYRVLDKGFIALKETMGDDFTIEQAARTSYGKGTRKVSETRGLLRYLMRHKHTTPFEMVEFKFHVKVPMDCWRQWIRHRTANVNEYSTRYSVAIDDCQATEPHEWRLQSGGNKQGSKGGSVEFPEGWWKSPAELIVYGQGTAGEYLTSKEKYLQRISRNLYEERLNFNIAREQARKDLPLSNYTIAYWKCDLHNIFHFLRLRCDSHAQKEIRDYAVIMASLIKEHCPLAFEAWYDYAFQAVNFTRLDRHFLSYLHCTYGAENQFDEVIELIKESLTEKDTKYIDELGMSKRELQEFWQKISVPDEVNFSLRDVEVLDVSKET